jgi:uncharacterized protein YjgD (DUF1641 family)
MQDSEGNEQNGYPVPDHNKTMINDTKEPSDIQKNTLTEEILQELTENFMENILDMVNKMYKMHSKNFKAPKMKNIRRNRNE